MCEDTFTGNSVTMDVLGAPHLEIGGWHNNGEILRLEGKTVLVAYKGNTWLAIAAMRNM